MMLGKEAQRLLLPVDIRFLWGSLLAALLLNLLPLGRITWMPDVLLLALVFWCLHEPRRVGVLVACGFGLVMDVHRSTLLGMHGLVYALAVYVVYLLHRRLSQFKAHWQALQLFGVFVAAHGMLWLLQLAGGGQWPGAGLWWAPVLETALWPVLDRLLLAPQRRAPDRDLTRPL